MLRQMGPLEWALIAVIVLLVFGVGRLGRLGKDLGEGIREFRRGISGNEDSEETAGDEETD